MTDWADIGVKLFLGLLSLLVSTLIMLAMMRFLDKHLDNLMPTNPVLNRFHPTPKQFIARLYCRHTQFYVRARDGYGRHYLMCGRCAKDLNSGKLWHEKA